MNVIYSFITFLLILSCFGSTYASEKKALSKNEIALLNKAKSIAKKQGVGYDQIAFSGIETVFTADEVKALKASIPACTEETLFKESNKLLFRAGKENTLADDAIDYMMSKVKTTQKANDRKAKLAAFLSLYLHNVRTVSYTDVITISSYYERHGFHGVPQHNNIVPVIKYVSMEGYPVYRLIGRCIGSNKDEKIKVNINQIYFIHNRPMTICDFLGGVDKSNDLPL